MQRYNARSGDTSPSVDTFNNLAEQSRENGYTAEAGNGRPNLISFEPSLELGEILNQDHQKMLLEESGLSQEVVAARGYRTIATKAELSGCSASPVRSAARRGCSSRSTRRPARS